MRSAKNVTLSGVFFVPILGMTGALLGPSTTLPKFFSLKKEIPPGCDGTSF
ncbi:hypothetical protein FD37_GL001490 [Levilactobacillus spicheri DSM 15429]|uniref:Uncharacterized protein n=1 Tax=Levilactobacillus spicheri DSM 15429 TaxID=1423805 RepID=A0A0R1QV01_9LACO|nr:hypothetical protein FD37_GL001490 [Levilactobacillus spicheri DSM 15429]